VKREAKGERVAHEIDWDALRRRVASIGETVGAPAAQVLEQRARRLAAARPVAEESPKRDFVTFFLGRERYAVAVGWVHEVVASCDIAPLPGAREPLAGAVNVRGQVLLVIDPRPLLGLEGEAESACLLVLGREEPEICVLVDEAGELASLAAEQLVAAPPGQNATPLVTGITRDGTIVLDGERLLDLEATRQQ
jgi:purine-binding chemotaxis protein CheW